MKTWILVPLAALVAVPTHFVARELVAAPGGRGASTAGASAPAESLRLRLDEVASRQAEQAARVGSLEARPAPAPAASAVLGEDAIADAVEAWLASRGLDAAALAEPPVAAAAGAGEGDDLAARVAELSMDELLALMLDSAGFGLDTDLVFEELRKSGRMDEYVAALEARVEADPDDPDLRVALGMSYLQALFGKGGTPESGVLAMKADAAFDAALELDGTNWDARFVKAVALSNWPAFLGRTNEAILHFEVLIEQQENLPPQDNFAETWLYLGNMYDQTGRAEEARSAWQRGLERFPDDAALRERLALAEGDGD